MSNKMNLDLSLIGVTIATVIFGVVSVILIAYLFN